MLIIEIEGIDKAGKAHQKKLLQERLEKDGLKVAVDEFHRYDTPTGQLIRRWLYTNSDNRPEDLEPYDVDQKTINLIMAADKQAQQKRYFDLEADGCDVLILDRYMGSQFAYGIVSNTMADKDMSRIETEQWLRNLMRYVRKPDATILINIPAEESMRRKGKHGENDRYESDLQLLESVRDTYFHYIDNTLCLRERTIIDGMQSIEDISDEIYDYVRHLIELQENECDLG